MAATLATGLFLLGGCSKQLPFAPSSSSKTVTSDDELVLTPYGMLPRSHTFLIEKGYHLFIDRGQVWKRNTATQALVTNLGEIRRPPPGSSIFPMARSRQTVLPKNPSNQRSLVPQTTDWVTFAQWQNTTGNPIVNFSTSWVVPPLPASYDDQTFFIFNGLESAQGFGDILQPVLQYGPSAASMQNTNHWVIANWYVWADGQGNQFAAFSQPAVVNANTALQGVMTSNDGAGGLWTYNSSFTGQNNQLAVAQNDIYFGNENGLPYDQNVQIPAVNQQTWAFITLEAYNKDGYREGFDVPFYYDYPATADVQMTNITMTLQGNLPATLSWAPQPGNQPFWGEYTTVVSNNSTGNGEVDLYYHSAAPEINGSSSYYFNAEREEGGGWIEASPGKLVTVTVYSSGPPGSGNYSTYFYLPSGLFFTNGLSQISCSGSGYSSTSAQFYMPAIGTIDWTGVFNENNQEGGGGVSVN